MKRLSIFGVILIAMFSLASIGAFAITGGDTHPIYINNGGKYVGGVESNYFIAQCKTYFFLEDFGGYDTLKFNNYAKGQLITRLRLSPSVGAGGDVHTPPPPKYDLFIYNAVTKGYVAIIQNFYTPGTPANGDTHYMTGSIEKIIDKYGNAIPINWTLPK